MKFLATPLLTSCVCWAGQWAVQLKRSLAAYSVVIVDKYVRQMRVQPLSVTFYLGRM